MNTLAPWLCPVSDRLRESPRFPQSLLIYGMPGLGKNRLAMQLASTLLCDKPQQGDACGQCHQCNLVQAGTHPDLHAVLSEQRITEEDDLLSSYGMRYLTDSQKKSGRTAVSDAILIDQIRAVQEQATSTPQIARRSVILLSPANRMNRNAANSLLKLLEEPPPTTHFILVADQLAALPATIRSRTQHFAIQIPSRDTAEEWLHAQNSVKNDLALLLDLAGGAPETALKLAKSGFLETRNDLMQGIDNLLRNAGAVPAIAAAWKKFGSGTCLRWLLGWISDLTHVSTGNTQTRLYNNDCIPRLRNQAGRLDLRKLLNFHQFVEQRYNLNITSNVDETLLLEEVLTQWVRLFESE